MIKYTLPVLLVCLLLSSCAAKSIPTTSTSPAEATTFEVSDSIGFPETWVGTWVGELVISNAKGIAQTLPMELHIQPMDTVDRFTWKIIYGEDKVAGARNYELVVKNREEGVYVVDELNSIFLECYLIGEKLFSWYLVNDVLILITNEKQGEQMIFEVVAGSHTPVSITGGQPAEKEGEDAIPEVSTYPVKSAQRALLQRKK